MLEKTPAWTLGELLPVSVYTSKQDEPVADSAKSSFNRGTQSSVNDDLLCMQSDTAVPGSTSSWSWAGPLKPWKSVLTMARSSKDLFVLLLFQKSSLWEKISFPLPPLHGHCSSPNYFTAVMPVGSASERCSFSECVCFFLKGYNDKAGGKTRNSWTI